MPKTTIKVMSFNLLCSRRTDERVNRVIQMIRLHAPDVLGVQEARPEWMDILTDAIGDEYDYAGTGRDGNGMGEYSAVFFRRDRFTSVSSATKWLSDTPDEVSKFDESSLNRVMTYCILECIGDGKKFVMMNTHFEHTNALAREKQAKVYLSEAKKLISYPVIMTGDFNCESDENAYKAIIAGGFADTRTITKNENAPATFHAYGHASSVIDYCFISPLNVKVLSYKVCSEMIDGDYASDHHPIEITAEI